MKTACPQCRKALILPTSVSAGQVVSCPGCHARIKIPATVAATVSRSASPPTVPPAVPVPAPPALPLVAPAADAALTFSPAGQPATPTRKPSISARGSLFFGGIGVVVGSLLTAIIFLVARPGSESTGTGDGKELKDRDTTPDATPVAELSANVFFRAYEKDLVAADIKYKGRVVSLVGVTEKVERDGDGTYYLATGLARAGKGGSLIPGQMVLPAARPGVLCLIPEKYVRTFAGLDGRTPMTIRGRCAGTRHAADALPEFVVVLEDCVAIPAPPPIERDRKKEEDQTPPTTDEDHTKPFIKSLDSPAAAERVKAIEAIGRLRKKGKPAEIRLCLACADSDATVRRAALEALGETSPNLQPLIVRMVINGGDAENNARILALRRTGVPAAHLIRRHIRIASETAVTGERKTILPFEGTGSDEWYRDNFRVLAELLPDAESLQAILAAMANMEKSEMYFALILSMQVGGIESIQQMAVRNKELRKPATAAMIDILKKPEKPVARSHSPQMHALKALEAFGPDARDALLLLKKMKFDPKVEFREAVEKAIRAIDSGM